MIPTSANIDVNGWTRSLEDYIIHHILREHQNAYYSYPYNSLTELVENGKRNILVIAGHLDDAVIGLGGTLAQFLTGMSYCPLEEYEQLERNEPSIPLKETLERKGLLSFPKELVGEKIQKRLLKGNINLNLGYEDPSNIIVVYVTDGAKTEETMLKDIKDAHPDKTIEVFLEKQGVDNVKEFVKIVNWKRYPETLKGLNNIIIPGENNGGVGVVYFDYSSSDIKKGVIEASEDIASLIKWLKPEVVYTHSSFEQSHPTHQQVANLTVEAIRALMQNGIESPELKCYFVWDPLNLKGREIVDITTTAHLKANALDQHSLYGTQGDQLGREYKTIIDGLNTFFARYQRPRNIYPVSHLELFFSMQELLTNHQMKPEEFVDKHLKETYIENFPQLIRQDGFKLNIR